MEIDAVGYSVEMKDFCLRLKPSTPSPVIFSIPHDGLLRNDLSGLFPVRQHGVLGRDSHVAPIVKDIACMYQASVVRGLMPRAFVDYNRGWPIGYNYCPLSRELVETALDDKRFAPAYYAYHEAIICSISEAISCHGKSKNLLLDMHGFTNQPSYAPDGGGYDIILGTGNRATIHHGAVDENLADFLNNRGYRVFLPGNEAIGPLEDVYSAGFITRYYAEEFRINAIQVEIAKRFRVIEGGPIGEKLASDFADFLSEYY